MGLGILFHDVIEDDVRRKDFKVLRFAGMPRVVGNSYIVYDKAKPLNCTAADFLALLREMKSRRKKSVNIRALTGTDPT